MARHVSTKNNIMTTQHVFFFILEGCVLLAVAVGTGMYCRRVIRGKHQTMCRLIRELEHWKKEWGILMRHLELLEMYNENNVETGHAPSQSQPNGAFVETCRAASLSQLNGENVETGRAPSLPKPNGAQQQLVDRLNHYILNDRNFSLHNDLSAFLTMNGDTLSEAVKAVTGKTLPEHVNRLRLEKARQLLKQSE